MKKLRSARTAGSSRRSPCAPRRCAYGQLLGAGLEAPGAAPPASLTRGSAAAILDLVRCLVASVASLVLAACAADAPGPSSEPPPPPDEGGEIDGVKVDPVHGRCTGVVGEPTWARCLGRCEPLDEAACRTAAGCRIAYSDDLRTPAEEHAFRECLPVAPGPAQAAACDALDAIGCSQREDCTALHAGLFFYAPFIRCEPRI